MLTCFRWLLLGLLVVAPWMQGAASAWASSLLSWMLLAVGAACLLASGRDGVRHFLGKRDGAAGSQLLVILLGAVLAYGWAVTACPAGFFDPAGPLLFHIDGASWLHWGTIHQEGSAAAMVRLSALVIAFVALMQMSSERPWMHRLIWAVACTGVSVAVYGALQKAVGDFLGLWGGRMLSVTVFACYWYHANAATFMNLCWPLLVYLGMKYEHEGRPRVVRWFVWPALVVVAVAMFINISKAGQALFFLQAVLLFCFHRVIVRGSVVWKTRTTSNFRHPLLLLVVAFLLLCLVGALTTGYRWSYLVKNPEHDQRLLVARLCLEALTDSGWIGWGPGTFREGFAAFTAGLRERPHGIWVFAHNDYLQCLLEWGIVGTLFFVALLLQAALMILRRLVRAIRRGDAQGAALLGSCLASGSGFLLHAAVDYPSQIASLQLYVLAIAAMALSPATRSRA